MTQTILSTASTLPATAPEAGPKSQEPIILEREIRRLRTQVEEMELMLGYQARATRLLAMPLSPEA